MSIADDKRIIENALQVYRQKLDEIPDEVFNTTPPGGGWSYAEVYSHIMQATLGSFTAVQRCSNGTGKTHTKSLNWLGRLILYTGFFPGMKFKAPESIASMTVNINKEEARNLIIKVRKRLDEIVPDIDGSPKFCKIKHPRFGMLNGKQWFRFIGIHLEHHLRQLKRIDKKFRKR